MVKEQKEIRIKADVYDTLEFAALAFGGIGAFAWHSGEGCPVCVNGFASFLGLTRRRIAFGTKAIPVELQQNDRAVDALRQRGIGGLDAENVWRVPFAAYAKELGLVRVEA